MERDNRIDNIRAIGTLLVILAHMSIPYIVLNARTFDVILLVMASAVSLVLSYNPIPYKDFVIKRFKRLVLPTYKMLILFFILSEILSLILNKVHAFNWIFIAKSFLFSTGGLGYIWIIRVYFLIALSAPLIYRMWKNVKMPFIAILFNLLAIFVGGGISWLLVNSNISLPVWVVDYVLYGYIYISISSLFVGLYEISGHKQKFYIISVCSLCFATFIGLLLLNNETLSIDMYKDPPRLVWITYGIFCSIFVYKLIPNRYNRVLAWLSRYSLDIYLMHILILLFYNKFLTIIAGNPLYPVMSAWSTKYLLVLGLAIILVLCNNYLNLLVQKRKR